MNQEYVAYMWLLFLRTPAKKTLPGETVDLGEIGEVREKDWTKATPYSPAQMRDFLSTGEQAAKLIAV